MTNSITDWMTGLGQGHTDPDNFSRHQEYVSAETIVVAVRPISIDGQGGITYADNIHGEGAYDLNDPGSPLTYKAIGTVQNINISQQRPSTQLWELGSRFSYFIPGKNVIQATLSKVILNGNSLLKTLYPSEDGQIVSSDENMVNKAGMMGIGSPGGKFDISFNGKPGTAYFFSNLASELFNIPMDIMLLILDSSGAPVHGMIMKQSYVQAHQMGAAAQQMVLVENAVIRCVRILPVATA